MILKFVSPDQIENNSPTTMCETGEERKCVMSATARLQNRNMNTTNCKEINDQCAGFSSLKLSQNSCVDFYLLLQFYIFPADLLCITSVRPGGCLRMDPGENSRGETRELSRHHETCLQSYSSYWQSPAELSLSVMNSTDRTDKLIRRRFRVC